jgi:transcriptional regulator with XRE-family HTH domain
VLADRLAELMRQNGVTQEALASACGVSQTAVSKWLAGSTPSGRRLAAIALFFRVRMEDLLRSPSGTLQLNKPKPALNGYDPRTWDEKMRLLKSRDKQRYEAAQQIIDDFCSLVKAKPQ